MEALVSVIVPCFNYARYLQECIDSVKLQTYGRWECIIVDDGSTDDTAEVCKRLCSDEPRVKYLRQTQAGPSAARNTGLRAARGDFVQFLDADDALEADKLRVHVEYLVGHAAIDVVVGKSAFFRRNPARTFASPFAVPLAWNEPVTPASLLAELVEHNFISINAALMRRSLFDAVGPFDPSLRGHEDWDLWLRCVLRGHRFAAISRSLDRALVRTHRTNSSAASQLMLKTAIWVREKIHSNLPPALQRRNAERLAEAKLRLGLELLRLGRMKEGWTHYREGLREAGNKLRGILMLPLAVPGVTRLFAMGRVIYRTLR